MLLRSLRFVCFVLAGFLVPTGVVLGISAAFGLGPTTEVGKSKDIILASGWWAIWAGAAGMAVALILAIGRAAWLRWMEPALPRLLELPASALSWGPLLCLISLGVIGACIHKSAGFDLKAPDRYAAREGYQDFKHSIDRAFRRTDKDQYFYSGDRETSIRRDVTPASLEYFEDLRRMALNADRAQVTRMSPFERAYLLTARSRFYQHSLEYFDGPQFFDRTLSEVWKVKYPVDPNPVANCVIHEIEVDGDTAILLDEEESVIAVVKRHDDVWLVDVPESLPAWNERFKQQLQEKGLTATSFDHRFIKGYMGTSPSLTPGRPLISWSVAPSAIMDGPRVDLRRERAYWEKHEPLPQANVSGAQSGVAYELSFPPSAYRMANSVSPEEYGKELFARGILRWDSEEFWEFYDDCNSWREAMICFKLAYEQAKALGESARVEVLKRSFKYTQHRQKISYSWAKAEPSVELADEMIEYVGTVPEWWRDQWLVLTLGGCADGRAREMLEEHVNLSDPDFPVWAAEAIAITDLERGFTLLTELLRHRDSHTAIKARKALTKLGFPQDGDEQE
jgi:hypothetical protein